MLKLRLMKHRFIHAYIFFMLLSVVHAQTRNVSGTVVSAKTGTPVSKATILVQNGNAVAANDNGGFVVALRAGNAVLHVSAVGYAARDVTINANDTAIIIRLEETSNDLNEVVVVGYSDKRRSELTSAVTTVKADKLKDVTTNDVGSLLQGKVAGLEVINS